MWKVSNAVNMQLSKRLISICFICCTKIVKMINLCAVMFVACCFYVAITVQYAYTI